MITLLIISAHLFSGKLDFAVTVLAKIKIVTIIVKKIFSSKVSIKVSIKIWTMIITVFRIEKD